MDFDVMDSAAIDLWTRKMFNNIYDIVTLQVKLN